MRVAAELVAGDVKMSVTEAAVEFCADYRRGVGIMLLNNQNEVLVGRRADAKDAWQMPQGGIDENEDPRERGVPGMKGGNRHRQGEGHRGKQRLAAL